MSTKTPATTFYRSPLIKLPTEFPTYQTIQIYKRNAYGTWRWYVVDPVQAAAIYDLTAVRTLLPMHKTALQCFGCVFEEVADPGEDHAA